MTKTLFFKDSVLFISIDGKEYEVLEQDIRLSLDGDRGSIPAKRVIENLGRIEWPGGVELIEREVPTGGSGSTSYPIFENVARLLPKEKKENKICIASHGPISTQAESDYKQFESTGPIDDSLNDNLPKFESSEPQRCPDCGYSLEDAQFNMDHHLCKNKDFFRNSGPQEKKPDSFYGYLDPDEVRKYIKEKLNKVARVMTEDCTYEEAERNWQNDNSPLSFIEYLKKYYTITRKPDV